MTDLDTHRIHEAFDADLASYQPSHGLVERATAGGKRRQRTKRGLMITGVGLTLCAVVAGGLVLSTGSTGTSRPTSAMTTTARGSAGPAIGPSIQLAGMNVQLPAGYQLSTGTATTCQAFLNTARHTAVIMQLPLPTNDVKTAHSGTVALGDVLVTNSKNTRGCIHSNLSDRYRLPHGVTAHSALIPASWHPTTTTIDGNYAQTAVLRVFSTDGTATHNTETAGALLYVRVAGTGGSYRLMTLVGWGIPASELIDLATQALHS